MFVDEAKVSVKAGDGGRGCGSFYHDLYLRFPRPDGGNGGYGGDVICVADRNKQTLQDYRFRQHFLGERGGHGGSKGKKGKDGTPCILRVPIGTIIKDLETGLLMKDLSEDKASVVVAIGGKAGIGNGQKKSMKPPTAGEERKISLELKLVADVGLIGFPNAGKSTVISNISKVRSKIANYPFTTIQPILGFVQGGKIDFIVADLPGIIEGAHQGKGLGDRFLRHAERTKILVHVIDMAGTEMRDPIEDFEKLSYELEQYSDDLSHKARITVANKMDLPEAKERLKKFKKKIPGKVFEISALEKKGLDKLVMHIEKVLCKENSREK